MNELNAIDEPRSTVRFNGVALEHHLSVLPPDTEPLTALAAVSLLLHVAPPEVAGRFNARFPDGGGGGVLPPSYDGGASFGPVPHELGDEPITPSMVAPLVSIEAGRNSLVDALPLMVCDWM